MCFFLCLLFLDFWCVCPPLSLLHNCLDEHVDWQITSQCHEKTCKTRPKHTMQTGNVTLKMCQCQPLKVAQWNIKGKGPYLHSNTGSLIDFPVSTVGMLIISLDHAHMNEPFCYVP